jgi:tetratricopeptide (TPR) repeat protein
VIRIVVLTLLALTASVAQDHLERGLRLYDLQQYDEAIAEFRAGYAIDANPRFLYALGQALRKKGDCPAAIESYRAYLRTAPAERQAQAAEEQIARCEAATPPTGVASASPPSSVASEARPIAVAAPPPPNPPRRRVYTWIGVGLTTATAVAGLALELTARNRYDALAGSCAPPHGAGCANGDIDALGREIDAATGLFVAAGALGVATVVAITLESRSRR